MESTQCCDSDRTWILRIWGIGPASTPRRSIRVRPSLKSKCTPLHMICCAKAPGWVKTDNDRCHLFNLVAGYFCWSTFEMMFHICRIWGHWHLCYLPGAATGAPPLGLFQAIVVSWSTSKPHILSHQIFAHVPKKHSYIEWNIVGPLSINVKNFSKAPYCWCLPSKVKADFRV